MDIRPPKLLVEGAKRGPHSSSNYEHASEMIDANTVQ